MELELGALWGRLSSLGLWAEGPNTSECHCPRARCARDARPVYFTAVPSGGIEIQHSAALCELREAGWTSMLMKRANAEGEVTGLCGRRLQWDPEPLSWELRDDGFHFNCICLCYPDMQFRLFPLHVIIRLKIGEEDGKAFWLGF